VGGCGRQRVLLKVPCPPPPRLRLGSRPVTVHDTRRRHRSSACRCQLLGHCRRCPASRYFSPLIIKFIMRLQLRDCVKCPAQFPTCPACPNGQSCELRLKYVVCSLSVSSLTPSLPLLAPVTNAQSPSVRSLVDPATLVLILAQLRVALLAESLCSPLLELSSGIDAANASRHSSRRSVRLWTSRTSSHAQRQS